MTIAISGTPAKNVSNSATTNCTPTAGSTLVWMSKTSSGAGTPTVTQLQTSGGANFSIKLATAQNNPSEWGTVAVLENCASGITSVTATFNGGTPGTVYSVLVEVSGAATASYLAAQINPQTAPGTTANAITSGTNVNVTSQPALILGIVSNNNSNGDTVAGTGFSAAVLADNDWCVFAKRITATGNQQVTATAATHGGDGGITYQTSLVALLETGGGAGASSSPGLDHRSQTFLAMGRR